MSRVENPELKKYAETFVVETLKNCSLFVRVFGPNFAKSRFSLNVAKVFSNEENKFYAGYHRSADFSITICCSGPNGELLKPEDLTEEQKEILLHEAIHAILERTKRECRKQRIEGGTGCLARNGNAEIGRGLNEGLTEWICSKAGYEDRTYVNLVKMIRALELAIGEENVMSLGKGDYNQNIPRLLGMSREEAIANISLADNLYYIEDRISKINNLLDILTKREPTEELQEEKNNNSVYRSLDSDDEYKMWLVDNGVLDSDKSRAEFLKVRVENYEKRAIYYKISFDSKIFDKYFAKEFASIKSMDIVPDELFDKYEKLYNLMKISNQEYVQKYLGYSSVDFIKDFEVIREKHTEYIKSLISHEVEAGTFTAEKLIKYGNYLYTSGLGLKSVDVLAGEMAKAAEFDADALSILLRKIMDERKKGNPSYEEINKYGVIQLSSSRNGSKDFIFLRDGKPVFSSEYTSKNGVVIGVKDDVETRDLINFTLSMDAKIEQYIASFDRLKSELLEIDPNATMTILNRKIAVKVNGKYEYYAFDDKANLLKCDIVKEYEATEFVAPKKREVETALVSTTKQSFFKNLLLKIKRKLFANKSNNINYVDEEKDVSNKGEKVSFEDSIKVKDFQERYEAFLAEKDELSNANEDRRRNQDNSER